MLVNLAQLISENPPDVKPEGDGSGAKRHWMKSTGGGMSAGTMVP